MGVLAGAWSVEANETPDQRERGDVWPRIVGWSQGSERGGRVSGGCLPGNPVSVTARSADGVSLDRGPCAVAWLLPLEDAMSSAAKHPSVPDTTALRTRCSRQLINSEHSRCLRRRRRLHHRSPATPLPQVARSLERTRRAFKQSFPHSARTSRRA